MYNMEGITRDIVAVYPDKTRYKMKAPALLEYMTEQKMPHKWQQHFFDSLLSGNIAYGPIARYYIN